MTIQEKYLAACNAYAREFEKITDTIFDFWTDPIQGRCGSFSDMFFTIEEIITVVDYIERWQKRYGSKQEAVKAIFRWYDYSLDSTDREKKPLICGRGFRVMTRKNLRNMKQPHSDCPFTQDQLDEFHAMLYSVNTSFHCCNPAPVNWAIGYQRHQLKNK